MAVIASISIEEALRPRTSKQPSARTLRTQALGQDAEAVAQAIQRQGAATINFAEEEQPDRYLGGLRAALQRKGYIDILMQKKRGIAQAVAWQMREEDKARVEIRRQRGTSLGQGAKERVAKQARANARSRRKAS